MLTRRPRRLGHVAGLLVVLFLVGCLDAGTGPPATKAMEPSTGTAIATTDPPTASRPPVLNFTRPFGNSVGVAVAGPGLDWGDVRFEHDAAPAVVHVVRGDDAPAADFTTTGPDPVQPGEMLLFCIVQGTANDIAIRIIAAGDHVVADLVFWWLGGCEDPRPCGGWTLHADRGAMHWSVPAEAMDGARSFESWFGADRPYDEDGRPMGRFKLIVEHLVAENGTVSVEAFLGNAGTRLPMAGPDGRFQNVSFLGSELHGTTMLTTKAPDPDALPDHVRFVWRYAPDDSGAAGRLDVEATMRSEYAEPC